MVEQNNHRRFQLFICQLTGNYPLIDTDIKKGTNELFAGVGYFFGAG
jgi:hypothetical protein